MAVLCPSKCHHPTCRGISVVIAGILVHLALGSSYTTELNTPNRTNNRSISRFEFVRVWFSKRSCPFEYFWLNIYYFLGNANAKGNFATYIISYLRVKGISPNVTYADIIWITAIGTISSGFTMFLSGFLERVFGPKITTLIGSWILSGFIAVTYFAIQKSFPLVVLTYGFLYGMGNSITYPVALNCVMEWFPQKQATAVGIVLAGYGFGAFLWNPLITIFINPLNKSPDLLIGEEMYFSQPELLDRVPYCFLLLGAIYTVLTFIGAMMTSKPITIQEFSDTLLQPLNPVDNIDSEDEEYPNNDQATTLDTERKIESDINYYSPKQALKTRQFYLLWLILLFLNQSIDFIVSFYKAYGQTFIHDDHFLSLTGALASVANAVGRILWGLIGDKISFKCAMLCLSLFLTTLLCTMSLTEKGGKYMFCAWIFLIYLTFSGTFSLLPATTQRSFGSKHYLIIYGLLFTSHIITGSLGCILVIKCKKLIGWNGMFLMSAGMAMVCSIFSFFYTELKPFKRKINDSSQSIPVESVSRQ